MMKTTVEPMSYCKKELMMYTGCKVINKITEVMHSTTKIGQVKETSEVVEEVEDMVEAADRSSVTIADNKDTSQGTGPTRLQPVSIVDPLIMLLKIVLFCK